MDFDKMAVLHITKPLQFKALKNNTYFYTVYQNLISVLPSLTDRGNKQVYIQ